MFDIIFFLSVTKNPSKSLDTGFFQIYFNPTMCQWSTNINSSLSIDFQALAAILKTGVFQGVLIPNSLVTGTSNSLCFYLAPKVFIFTLQGL